MTSARKLQTRRVVRGIVSYLIQSRLIINRMSTLLALKKPCFEYKSSFKTSKFEKVKLKQNFDDGTSKTKECPVFTGEFGIESLLYIEEKFRKIASQLKFDTGIELFDAFSEVVSETAEEKWDTSINNRFSLSLT